MKKAGNFPILKSEVLQGFPNALHALTDANCAKDRQSTLLVNGGRVTDLATVNCNEWTLRLTEEEQSTM